MQNCEHNLILGETNNKYTCFVCFDCLKVDFVSPIKDTEEFKCNCTINEISNNLKFNFKGNYIYCSDCKKILKE